LNPGDDAIQPWDEKELQAQRKRLAEIRAEIAGKIASGPIHRNSTNAVKREWGLCEERKLRGKRRGNGR
jgi:hypothetical protein